MGANQGVAALVNTPAPTSVQELPEKFQSFLRERGLDSTTPVIPLKDGGNNQVFRLPGPEGDFVLKRYFQDPDDPRDRYNTERIFYDLLWTGGVRQIPEPFAWDDQSRLGLFTFVPGRKLAPGEITRERVEQAAQFILQINTLRGRAAARAVAAASEARFSVAEQTAGIALRVEALQQIAPESGMDAQALAFAREDLLPAWRGIEEAITRDCSSNRYLSSTLDAAQRCLSPSDFGFHNALLMEGAGLHFIDFEYAGWDDPAKLVCDFFCQPQVPVGFQFWDFFLGKLAAGLGDESRLPLRAKVLLPAYQIKWCCIILNHFLKGGKARREFAHGSASESTKASQLEKARRLLKEVRA
jgi:hypothetical protein